MSDESRNNPNIERILDSFAGTLEKHAEKTDTALEKLTETVQKLADNQIETKKDREYDSARAERIEENQKEQGKKIETLSNTVLLLDERVGNQKNKWAEVGKIAGAIITAVLIAKLAI